MSKGLQIGICVLSVFVGIAWWVSAGGVGQGTFEYYSSVKDFQVANRDVSRMLRVHGFVVPGSIARNLTAGHVDFAIHDRGGDSLVVRYQGIDVPDLFGDGAEVVVEGRTEGPRFLADRVMAKCPSKYEAAPETPEANEARSDRPTPRA